MSKPTPGKQYTVVAGDTLPGIARQAYVLMTAGIVLASALLMYLILTHDYRLAYVYAYSDNSLPLNYLISTPLISYN